MSMIDLTTLEHDMSKLYRVRICSSVVGCNQQITYNEEQQSLVIQPDFQKLRIIPMLHQNVVQFKRMSDRSTYLYGRQAKDKFVALSRNGHVYKWDILTGKRLTDKDNILGKDKFVISDKIYLQG